MNKFRKFTFVIALLIGANVTAQIDLDKTLFSKMDINPQFELWDGTETMLMGYTELLGGSINLPSPVLTFVEGDSVKLTLSNFSQAAPHTIHLHGLDVNQQNDGVPHLSFEVEHLEEGDYYFKAPHPGTYLYHCHVVSSLHVQAGMYGLIIVKPADESNTTWTGGYAYGKEYAWLMSELDINWHHDTIINHPHDPLAMNHTILDYEPQYFLVNGKSEQQLDHETTTVSGHANEYIYLRLANVGYFGNRLIFPAGLNANIIASDGRPLPTTELSDTLEIMPGERYGVLLNSTTELTELIQVEYFNLNTPQVLENTQLISVNINGFLTVDTMDKNESITIYPNPASDEVYIDFENLEIEKLDVYNILGETIYSNSILKNNLKLNVNQWKNGVYIIKYTTHGKLMTKKLTIKK
jgi:FtsP/CotA-like multicopper oxidase with cupredoxin domain